MKRVEIVFAILAIAGADACCQTSTPCVKSESAGVHHYPLVDLAERENAEVAEDGISCAVRGVPMHFDALDDAARWSRPEDYGKGRHLRISFDEKAQDGRPCLTVTGIVTTKCDTAWSVAGRRKDFSRQADRFLWTMDVEAPVEVPNFSAYGEKWQTSIHWYDAAGEELPQSVVIYSVSTGGFRRIRGTGKIPAGAASFAPHIGFDTPNIGPGEVYRFRNLEISQLADKPMREPFARVTSYPRVGGRVSWVGRTPPGTRIRFQYAGAETPEALRGAKFRGPGGTDKTFFESPFDAKEPFVRYRAFLYSANAETPVLERVTVGSHVDGAWADRADLLPPTVRIVSPSPTRDVRIKPVLTVEDPSMVAWDMLAVRIDGRDETARFVRDGNRLMYAGRDDAWAEGLHEIEVSVSDWCGNACVARKTFFIGDAPTTPCMAVRDDGVTLVDGKPFFPIGIYGFKACEANGNDLERGVLELKDAGFNVVHTYMRPILAQLLAICEKHGMMTFRGPRWPDETALEVRHSPAVLAWYLGDDTSAHMSPGWLVDEYDAMKSIDPYRLTCQADGGSPHLPVTHYYDYVVGTDAFLPEIYPVHDDSKECKDRCVAAVVRAMKRFRHDVELNGMGPRSMWPILQYFKGWTNWKCFPTRDELFAMSFAAIVHGAHGITWYTYFGGPKRNGPGFNYGAVSTPERKAIMFELARRIADLSPVLLERTPANQPVPEIVAGTKTDVYGQPSVTCLLKRHGRKVYLLAVNAVRSPVRVRVPLSGIESTGEAIWENGRRVSLVNGVLEDEFGPHAVHIYRFGCR